MGVGSSNSYDFAASLDPRAGDQRHRLELNDGSRVAVIGGGPSGSLFTHFALKMAELVGLKLAVDIFELDPGEEAEFIGVTKVD